LNKELNHIKETRDALLELILHSNLNNKKVLQNKFMTETDESENIKESKKVDLDTDIQQQF